jgi:Fic family protein
MMTPVKYHYGKFPPQTLDWEQLVPLVGRSNAALARYDGLLSAIPNADLLLSPLLLNEAVLSSKIEGTQVSMGEVLELEAGGEPIGITQPRRDDAEEVLNYREALYFSSKSLKERPFSQSLLRESHALLMQGVRGGNKSPGSYRNEQNWIGTKGCTIDTASFIPIAPEHLQGGMDSWEAYLNDKTPLDPLVQLALLHLEFEALHPFRDGNGRLGRMLIPLFLYYRRLLSSPNFYMSGYLESCREEYLEIMRSVSLDDEWSRWVKFFLQGIVVQAKDNEIKAWSILNLYNCVKEQIVELTHSQHAIKALDFLFRHPVFLVSGFVKNSDIPKASATRIIKVLCDNRLLKIVREGRGRRSGVYVFEDLLMVAEGKQNFESHL